MVAQTSVVGRTIEGHLDCLHLVIAGKDAKMGILDTPLSPTPPPLHPPSGQRGCKDKR